MNMNISLRQTYSVMYILKKESVLNVYCCYLVVKKQASFFTGVGL